MQPSIVGVGVGVGVLDGVDVAVPVTVGVPVGVVLGVAPTDRVGVVDGLGVIEAHRIRRAM